jgi:hypothetical protein
MCCNYLTSVTIPNSVTSIRDNAFGACMRLTAINVASGNTAFTSENGVLYNKDKTTLICYPMGKTGSAFTIPNSVTRIGGYAFFHCTSLASVVIPNSVTSIGEDAFSGSGLTSITIPDSVTSIEQGAFCYCIFTSVSISNSVTSIGSAVFSECASLTNITIPSSVTSIESFAFYRCTSLTSVTFEGTITSSNLHNDAFGWSSDSGDIGDLRDRYLAGGPGTYTRPNTGEGGSWSKQ